MDASFTSAGGAARFLLRHARRRDVVVLLLLVVGVSLTDGIGVLTLVPILGQLQSGGGGAWSRTITNGLGFLPSILDLLLAMVALAALRAVLTYGKQVKTLAMQNAVIDALRARVFGAVLHADWSWLVQRRGSDHANLIITNVSRIALGFGQSINAAAIVVVVLGYLAAAFLLSWRLALLTIALGAVVLALFAGNRARSTRLGHAVGQANRALHGFIAQAFAGIRVIKAYGVEDRQTQGFAHALADLSDQGLHNERNGAIGQGVLQVGGAAALAAVLGIGHLVLGAPLPTLLPLLLVFARLAPMLGSFQTSWSMWRYAHPAVTEMQAFLAEVEAEREPVAAPGAMSLTRVIELRGVGVDFAGRDLPALDDVTLMLPVNSTTALCGASGAGKSTLADLLMGLIAPTRGQLLVDGRPLDGAARIAWRAGVAYVQQDAFLFHDTIRANILLGRAYDDAAIARALHRAGAAFVLHLPAALDTIVGDAGMRLSGGERQRIALARALVGSPALLILDEATSALDATHEMAVRETMRSLRGQVTLLFISHRESMREDADQVVFLRGGRIVPADT